MGDSLKGRDLLDGKALQFEEDHGLALLGGKARKRPGYAIGPPPLVIPGSTVFAGHIYACSVLSLQREKTTPETTPGTIPVHREKYRVKPGLEARLITQGVELLVRAYHGFLKEVVTVFGCAAEAPRCRGSLIVNRPQQFDQVLPGFRGFHDKSLSSVRVDAIGPSIL
jgi:hypothetical protein